MIENADESRQSSPPSTVNRGYRPFLLVVLFFSLYLAYLILRPFLHTLIFAIVLASLFYPVQLRLSHSYGGRKNLAALTVVFLITFVIAIPVLLFLSALVSQGLESINRLTAWLNEGNLHQLLRSPRVTAALDWLQDRVTFVDLQRLDLQSPLVDLSKAFGQFLLAKGTGILGDVANLVSHFFVMVFIIFYLVRDGRRMIETTKYLSPLRDEQEDRILGGIRMVARSVLLASFLTALAQGLAGGIGLAIVGIPGLFWGTVMGFSSLIPVIGTALVWVPAVIYLILLGQWKSGVFLTLWSVLLVGSIDNFIRPFLMKGGANMSPFYIFLAIIGGVQYFGLAGVLYGPLILSFAMVMLYIYAVEYRDLLEGGEADDSRASRVLPGETGESSP